MLTPNDRVATLVSLVEPEVRFTLGDAQFGRLSSDGAPLEGRKITAVWRSGDAEQSREGVISRVAPLANARDGGFDVYAKLAATDGSGGVWRPGAFVEVRLADAPVKDAISLPQSALFPAILCICLVLIAGWSRRRSRRSALTAQLCLSAATLPMERRSSPPGCPRLAPAFW